MFSFTLTATSPPYRDFAILMTNVSVVRPTLSVTRQQPSVLKISPDACKRAPHRTRMARGHGGAGPLIRRP